ncbi:MAG: (2Fe-2S) ferredoxin domain-containing protein [Caldilineaceae bacterium]
MPHYEKHVFVCTNGPFCWYDGDGDAILEAFKKRAAAAGLKDTVRFNRSGCLNACGHGPVLVVYPEAIWYGHVTIDDVGPIFDQHILGGQPVERLILPDEATKSTEHYPEPVQTFKRVERGLDDQRVSAREAILSLLRAQKRATTDD